MDRDVLVVGESLVDIVRGADGSTVEYAGGSAANVAVALARLGRPVRFATSFADDERGRIVAEHLKGAGVELAADPAAVARTSTAVATIGADGAAHYDFDLEWRLHPVELSEPPLVVHTCSLGAVLTPGADDVYALLDGLRGQATISYDVNARPAITGTGPDIVARVERMVAISDLVKASDEDLNALYPDVDHLVAARNLLALGPAAVVVTRERRRAANSAEGTTLARFKRIRHVNQRQARDLSDCSKSAGPDPAHGASLSPATKNGSISLYSRIFTAGAAGPLPCASARNACSDWATMARARSFL